MPLSYRKSAKGGIEVLVRPGLNLLMLANTMRMRDSFRIEVMHFLDPGNMISYFALDGLRMCLTNAHGRSGTHFGGSGGRHETGIVEYRARVFLVQTKLSDHKSIYLVDERGWALAGSNVYGGSANLCLGPAFNPLSLQPVEALIYNAANNDLGWAGDALEGSWANSTFTVKTWKTIKHVINLPSELLDATAHWLSI